MRWWLAIPFSIFLFFLASTVAGFVGNWIIWALVIITALWAAFDSRKVKLHQYKSAMPYKPLTVFIVIAFLWIVGFPWYLTVRHRIKTGKAILREDPDAHSGILSRGI